MPHQPVWEGSPSHWRYINRFGICLATCFLVVPMFLLWRYWNDIRRTRYTLTPKTVSIVNENNYHCNRVLEIYRIQNIELRQTPFQKKVGLADVIIHPMEKSVPPVVFSSIRDYEQVRQRIEEIVQAFQSERKIQEIRLPVLR